MRSARKLRETTKCRNEDMERGTNKPKWPTAYLDKNAIKAEQPYPRNYRIYSSTNRNNSGKCYSNGR
jgi:hypothetical protein